MTDWAQKTLFIPYMCDHSFVLQAALEALGQRSEVLPPPDDISADLGMDLVLGRECSPCLLVAGDIVRRLTQPGFDPSRAVVLLSTAAGPCRFGQYNVLLRHILDEHGLREVEIVSPSAENSYQGFGDHPVALRKLAWNGIVALDLLQRLLHAYRPYEANPGEADAIYLEGLQRILAALRTRGKHLVQTVKWFGHQFETLPIIRGEPRPLIGLVGEAYLRFSWYANRGLIRKIEELGGEIALATMTEWFYYTNWWYIFQVKIQRDYRAVLVTRLTDLYQRTCEFRLVHPVAHLFRHPYESRTAVLMRQIEPYFNPAISTETVLTIGKAIELARNGACGILNVMPFSCMPGIMSAGLAPRVRRDLDNIPWLDISYDMQKTTNIETRLEAFMYQAAHYQHSRHEGKIAQISRQNG